MTKQDDTPIEFQQGSVKRALNGASSADLWKVKPDRLRVAEGFNVRDKDAEYGARVRAIANSIIENGYMDDKPIAGYVACEDGEDFVYITDGHTRYDAVLLAISEGHEITHVPVVTKPRGTSMEDLTIALVTSNTGEKLKPMELARVCKRLMGYGMEASTIAKRIGVTHEYVNQLLDLLAAPKSVRDLVSSGKISATLAIETTRKHGVKEAVKLLSEGVKEATASGKERATAKHVKKVVEKKAEKASKKKDTAPAPTPVSDTVQNGVAWLVQKGLTEDVNCLLLISHLSGVEFDYVQMLADTQATAAELQATAAAVADNDRQQSLGLEDTAPAAEDEEL